MKKKLNEQDQQRETIIEAIADKKGQDITILDLRKINEAVTDYFIICHGDSTRQVNAIAENILEKVKKKLNTRPWHSEGLKSTDWVLLDFVDIVVHVFYREKRYFYQLEELWNDAEVIKYEAA